MNTAQSTSAGILSAEDLGTVHLIGVGGVGMSGLARLLLSRGVPVSGSELREWPSLVGLRALGGTIHMTHDPANLEGVDTVVYSTAIPQDHLEMVEARRRGLRLMHRSEALAAAMVGRLAIAVAGTHGKTTTTSMIVRVLQQAGEDPSFVIGGETAEAGSNGHHGTGGYFVVEADESDRSFLLYRPYISIITNVDADHLNTYGDYAGLAAAFADFARLTDPAGFVVTCADDPGTRRLADILRAEGRRVLSYGEALDADLLMSELSSTAQGVRYQARTAQGPLGEIRLPVPGRHLGLNSAAALLVAEQLGLPLPATVAALETFAGVRRRFERKGVADEVLVYDEYAYHPTSMTLALQTLRDVAGKGRLIVVFQPYRVYRTRDLLDELAAALAIADELVLMEVFGPGEAREPGEGSAALIEAVGLPAAQKVFVEDWEAVPVEVVRRARPGDVVVTMGAPPISLMGDQLLAALAERAGAGTDPDRAPGSGLDGAAPAVG